ncbi:hypothetical protein SOASR030_26410 [Leminorella grimontii]|uniref:Type II secretion system protein GspF domain-containing protein n=1 Tax=Leminorella grimontii TaxID=82981 RepID=A0AAV5N487_9GAMM|nr:type II secretion system F family protein [Leminorella grimontii]KFC94785.1 type II/IV secretion system protein [Leminorella grimontii ATCC 33999 = DSM 5078]GKX56529.1 hypothetical protein SOASR030_26410 [Leminorella grimontii]GKX59871.1 hypothetical protein SOASR031_21860 [Leminorella grimontii]VFS61555.1 Flp pilus assembly protein TadB [Leminorella grimontii]
MTIFYLMLVVLGCAFILLLLRERQLIQRVKQAIEGDGGEVASPRSSRTEYESLIINNSRIIRFFNELDKNVGHKLMLSSASTLLAYLAAKCVDIHISLDGVAIIAVLMLIVAIVVPAQVRNAMMKRKVAAMMNDMPYFIDLVAVCVQAGMTIESSLEYVSARFGDMNADLAKTLDRVIRQAEVRGLESALKELYATLPTLEIKMLCSTLGQSVYFGTSVYEQLMDLSKDIRDIQLLGTEEKVGKLSAKMSIPLILLVMFPIVILIAAPGLLRILSHV